MSADEAVDREADKAPTGILGLDYLLKGGLPAHRIHLVALSVVKKRTGVHETFIREIAVEKGRLMVGQPLTDFRGVLTGVPEYTGNSLKARKNA